MARRTHPHVDRDVVWGLPESGLRRAEKRLVGGGAVGAVAVGVGAGVGAAAEFGALGGETGLPAPSGRGGGGPLEAESVSNRGSVVGAGP